MTQQQLHIPAQIKVTAVINCFNPANVYIDEAQLTKKRWIKHALTLIERNNLNGDKTL